MSGLSSRIIQFVVSDYTSNFPIHLQSIHISAPERFGLGTISGALAEVRNRSELYGDGRENVLAIWTSFDSGAFLGPGDLSNGCWGLLMNQRLDGGWNMDPAELDQPAEAWCCSF